MHYAQIMRIDISLLPALAAAFMLVFARIGAMVMLLPGLGETNIPVRIKLAIALLLTLVILPLHRAAYHIDMQSLTPLLVLMLHEIVIGIVLGATARVTLSALQVAGSVIAQQLGLGFVTAVDPTQGQQGLLIGNFLTILGLTLLFATDSHHLVIAALNDSYAIFSPGEMMPSGDVAALATRAFAAAFKIGMQLSAPFLVFGLVFNIGLGVLARLMPQMQVYFVGVPLSILAGFLIFALVIAAMMGTFLDYFIGVMHDLIPLKLKALEPMADENDTSDKTEDPTQKRLDDAHDRGDVAKSQEINTWFVIAGATLVLSTFSGSIGGGILMPLRNLVANSWMIHADGPGLLALSQSLEYVLIAALGVPLLMLALAAIAGNMVQHRLVWSGESLKPKFSKISPAAGAKRIFGKQAAANFGKGLFKVIALGVVMTAILWPERHRLEAFVRFDPAAILGVTTGLTLHLLGAVVAMLAVVAIADYFFQYRQWFERQKMSLQEMKEEFKQSEGDPHVKGRIRQLRHARMKKRMMAAVPKASVIITNPTHYAVALSYERGMSAPVCVAKGVDTIALKIREIAKAHDIPIVENVPLARALHATVEIDDEIPVEHYHAVAEIIGYVMGLKRGLSGRRA